MIFTDALIEVETGHKELVLIRRLVTHHGKNSSKVVARSL
jgi:ribosomal protein S24E